MATQEQELSQLEDLYQHRSNSLSCANAATEVLRKMESLRADVENAPYDKLATDNCAKLDRWRETRIAEQTKVNKRNAILIGVLGAFTALPAIIVAVWLHKNAEERATKKVALETAVEYRDACEKDKEAAEENERRKAAAKQAMAERVYPEVTALAEKGMELDKAMKQALNDAKNNPLYSVLENESVEELAFLIEKMRSGRADSLKEALLLLDQQRVVDEKTARELQWRLEDLEIHEAERAADIERAEEAEREAERRQRSIENELYKTRRVIQIYGK